jgi:hypothetical protein
MIPPNNHFHGTRRMNEAGRHQNSFFINTGADNINSSDDNNISKPKWSKGEGMIP